MARVERAGLARAIFIFFAGLAAAGFVFGILSDPFSQIMTVGGDYATTSEAAKGRGYVQSFWDALPFIMVFLALAQLIGAAASERRLPGQ
jgi:hypothetical protein